MTKFDKINSEAIYELHYQEDMRAKGIPYQVSNLVIYTAISALEKQIPKKPRKTRTEIVCPTCATLVGSSPYCRYCGQKLDWSDTE